MSLYSNKLFVDKKVSKFNIQFGQVRPDISTLIARAIALADEGHCNQTNTVHLFVAALDAIKHIDNILAKQGTNLDKVVEYLKSLEESGYLGSDGLQFSRDIRDTLDSNFFEMLGTFLQCNIVGGEHSEIPEALSALLCIEDIVNKDSILEAFLDDCSLNIHKLNGDLQTVAQEAIPSDIADYIHSLNQDVMDENEEIHNVDGYVNDMINILCRKKKANPCLVGASGVGKTTIVHRLVQKILSNEVPESLRKKQVIEVDNDAIMAGTIYRGQFEERLKSVINYAQRENVILFMDEMHVFLNMGARGDDTSQSVGNMLKTYLAKGKIKIIGTTTLKEYHKLVERDSALNRRLQRVLIKEPSIEDAITIVKKSVCDYEQYHGVTFQRSALEQAVKLSARYIREEMLPDKAFKILDQAASTVKIREEKQETKNGLRVTVRDIEDVVSTITGVEVNKLGDNMEYLMHLEENIHKELIGQDEAVNTVCRAIRRGKAGIQDPNRPIASFLFVGPTGVGKTELCKQLSKQLFSSTESFIRVDMSELQEKFSVSKLIGTAPGYVGYGDGGNLTEKVRHNPYSILLLDEIEKAHPDIFDIFLQVLDEGTLKDGEGNEVDFRNCIIVMTSNAGYGAESLNKRVSGFNVLNTGVDDSARREKIAMDALESTFKVEFLNRIDNIVIFDKLTKEQIKDVTRLMLSNINKRLADRNIEFEFTDSVVEAVSEAGYSEKYGARNISRMIQSKVMDSVSDAMICRRIKSGFRYRLSMGDSVAGEALGTSGLRIEEAGCMDMKLGGLDYRCEINIDDKVGVEDSRRD